MIRCLVDDQELTVCSGWAQGWLYSSTRSVYAAWAAMKVVTVLHET